MSATDFYLSYKAKFDRIKPVRGHKPELRPIDKRRKLHEQIREVVVDGVKGIALRLYSTDCVTYLENGNILLSSGGYNSQTTQKFIHAHSHLRCIRQHNHLWVYVAQPGYGRVAVPLPKSGANLMLEYVEASDTHRIVFPGTLTKRAADKQKAKEARAPLMPFLNWVKAFLTLSDGFVAMPKPPIPVPEQLSRGGYHKYKDEDRYTYLANMPEEDYLVALYSFATFIGAIIEYRDGGMIFSYSSIKRYLYDLAIRANDAYKYTIVELNSRPIKDMYY